MNRILRKKLILVSLCFSFLSATHAATLNVCVKDPSRAAIPSAATEIYLRETQQRTAGTTGADGCVHFARLDGGNYELSVQANGFATEQSEVNFDGSADRSVDVQMRVGHTSQTTVVTADRSDEEIDSVPASVSLIDHEDLASRQSAAISDVLGELPNVEDSGGPRPSAQIPAIRAFSGPEIIVLVDGARLNFSNGLFSPIYIEPSLISEAEVIRGTSSTTYGTGGMGGVLALRTATATDELDPGHKWGGQVGGGYNSGDTSQHYNSMFYGAADTLDWLADFGYRDYHAIHQGGGTELNPNNGHDYTGLMSAGWHPTARWHFRLGDEYYQDRDFRPNNPQADATFPYLQHNHIQQNVGTLHASRDQSSGDGALQFSLYRASSKFWVDGNTTSSAPATNTVTTTWGGNVQNTSRIHSDAAGNHGITYGFDSYDDYEFALSAGTPNPVIPNGHQTDYGLFVLDRMAFGEHWTLSPGLRFDHFATSVDVNNGTQPSSSLSRVSPRVALSFSPVSLTMFYADFGQAFRAPVLSELYESLTLATGFANFIPNPGLRDERSNQAEVGTVLRRRGLFNQHDSFRFRAAGFYSADRDLIESDIVGSYQNPFLGSRPIFQAQNVSRAERWGGEFEAQYSSGGWFAKLAGSHIMVIDRLTGDGLYSPPDKLVGSLYYQFSSPNISLHWTGTAVASQDYDSVLSRRRGGYGVQDIFASWFPSGFRRLRLDLGIANLLGKRYSIYKDASSYPYVPEMGRDVRVNAVIRF